MKMRTLVSKRLFMFLLLLPFFSVRLFALPVNDAEIVDLGFHSDSSGYFIHAERSGSSLIVKSYGNSGIMVGNFHENLTSYDAGVSAGRMFFLLDGTKYEQSLLMMKCGGGALEFVYLNDMQTDSSLIALGVTNSIYAVDISDLQTVHSFTFSSRPTETYFIGRDIKRLFSFAETDEVFAVVDGGIVNVLADRFLPCDTPGDGMRANGSYFWDDNGDVFSFNPDTGFEKIYSGNGLSAVTTAGKIYTAAENRITLLDDDHEPAYYLDCSGKVELLLAAGKTAAYVVDGGIHVFHISDMHRVSKEKSQFQHEESSHSSQESSEKPQESTEPSVRTEQPEKQLQTASVPSEESSSVYQDFQVASNSYSLKNGVITGIEPLTTIAELKKNIEYGGATLTVRNHNGVLTASGKLGTGWKLEFFDGVRSETYYTVIKGDLTGEGNTNSRDIKALSQAILTGSLLDEPQRAAADMDGNGEINCADLYALYCHQ